MRLHCFCLCQKTTCRTAITLKQYEYFLNAFGLSFSEMHLSKHSVTVRNHASSKCLRPLCNVPLSPQPKSLTLINWGLSSNWPALTNTIHQLLITQRLETCSGGNCVRMELLYSHHWSKLEPIAISATVILTCFS